MAKWKKPVGKPHIVLRGNTYYARLTVPEDARCYFGKSELWQSLKTKSLRDAEYRAARIVTEWKAQIESYRGNTGLANDALEWRRVLEAERRKDQIIIDQFRRQNGANSLTIDKAYELGIGSNEHGYSDYLDRLYEEKGPEIADSFDSIVKGQLMPTMCYVEQYKASLKVIPRTLQQRCTHLDYLNQRFPTLPIKRSDVAKWIIEMETQGLAEATIKGRIGTCRSYFEFLQRLDYLNPDDTNPFEGHKYNRRNKASKQEIRQAFEVCDIPRLIDAAQRKSRRDTNLAAAIKIAAYTGMRREEIARLKIEHVKEREGINYFDIIDAKTKAGIREVPIHSELLSLIANLVLKTTDGYLLPEEPTTKNDERGDAIGKRFKTLRDSLGFDARYVFHSIRKTVSTVFERAGVNHNEAAEIVGHEKTGMTYGLYSAGMSLDNKYKIISVIKY